MVQRDLVAFLPAYRKMEHPICVTRYYRSCKGTTTTAPGVIYVHGQKKRLFRSALASNPYICGRTVSRGQIAHKPVSTTTIRHLAAGKTTTKIRVNRSTRNRRSTLIGPSSRLLIPPHPTYLLLYLLHAPLVVRLSTAIGTCYDGCCCCCIVRCFRREGHDGGCTKSSKDRCGLESRGAVLQHQRRHRLRKTDMGKYGLQATIGRVGSMRTYAKFKKNRSLETFRHPWEKNGKPVSPNERERNRILYERDLRKMQHFDMYRNYCDRLHRFRQQR